jgi:pyruvate/2-oxoglutarate dehydrogenase complex dihydrolipoamide dehydrogenase (E3) component
MPAYDAIIIGTGQSGPALADRMNRAGLSVAIIERKLIGGTCVNTGCVPTKTLVASARAAYIARRAADFGVVLSGPVRVDMKQVKARKDAVSGASNRFVTKWLESLPNSKIYRGHARFVSATKVQVGDEMLEAPKIFLNVGARAVIPKFPGLDQVPYWTNSNVMDVDFLPPHLIILGGSYVGLEFGQMYRRFGSEVTIVERGPRLISRDDEDVSAAVKEILQKEGIDIRVGTQVSRVERRGERLALVIKSSNGDGELVGSHLLVAIGRRPNTDDLGVEAAGVKLDSRGYVEVDDQLRTSVPGIWAMGDCNGRGAFTHTSYNDYEIIAANLFDNDPRRVSDRIVCYGLFIDPPLGRAGMTEAEARATGKRILVGKHSMTKVSRARERSETDGFIKILVDAESKLILGAAILGIEGDEVIHTLLDVMYAKKPYTVIQRAVHIHPTVAELIPTTLGELQPLT